MQSKTETSTDYIVTARRWRPQKFSDIIGQHYISTTLKNAIINNRLHHAYLFSGPRGIGKTTTARILARAINCLSPIETEPCNQCLNCISILEGRSLDVIEIDGASNNSVDDIRTLRENSKYPPSQVKYKLYIIDEVHMLSNSAFNALLKTLEEPPPHLMFVFATTEIHKVPATILSRCQRFDFRRIIITDIVNHLRNIANDDNVAIDEESLFTIAKKADGSMRDAQSLYDQVVAFCGKDINYSSLADSLNLIDPDFYFTTSKTAKEKNISKMLELSKEVNKRGYNLQECLNGLLEHYRNILTINVSRDKSLIDSSESFHQKYIEEAENYEKADLLRILQHISINEQALRYASQPKLRFELTLIQLASIDDTLTINELISEIRNLNASQMNKSIPESIHQKSYSTPKIKATVNTVKESRQENLPPQDKENVTQDGITNKSNNKTSDIHTLEQNWDLFIKKYANTKYGIYMAKEAKPIFLEGTIILSASNTFVFENLNTNRNLILQYVKEFFGQIIDLKIQLEAEQQDTNSEIIPPNSNLNDSESSNLSLSEDDKKNLDPVEIKLIELFGAKKLISNT